MASIVSAIDPTQDVTPEDDGFEMILNISSETRNLLAKMAVETGGNEFEVIGKAVALYRVVLDAKREGHRIGLFNAEEELEREIVGF